MRKVPLLGVLMLAQALTLGLARAAEDTSATIAITANGNPVAELYRGADGTFRYAIDDDIALGMSLGVSPINLTRRVGADSPNNRWLPSFDAYREPASASAIGDGPMLREPRKRQWFWTIGVNDNFVGDDDINVRSELFQNFSLQTKAGFLVPLGRSWLLGGAITVDHVHEPGSPASAVSPSRGTDVGAFLGVEFNS